VRAPYFVRGKQGRIVEMVGYFGDPARLAYGDSRGPAVALYRIRFDQATLWTDYAGPDRDSVVADIYETWLEPVQEGRE
jgi:nitrile hydratase